MRLPRTSLLARLTAPEVPAVVLLEAPPGFGKSWLARRAVGSDVLRLRGELGPLSRPTAPHRGPVLIDDAHLLADEEVALLVERIEDAGGDGRLVIAGRILGEALHEVAQLVDGLIIDTEALMIVPEEILAELPDSSSTMATRLCESADGSVRVIATSLDQAQRDTTADPIAVASHMVRIASEAALQHLSRRERSVVGLLARAPGIDTHLLERLGGTGFVRRAAIAGVPLRRQITGALEVANASVLRTVAIDPDIAAALADDMLGRERALEAIGLVLDAGDHERATAMMKGLSESVTDTVEPRPLLSLLARLGSSAEREPALLLLRAEARRAIGRVDEAINDLDQAVVLAATAPAPLRRRVAIEAARARMAEGDRDDAERIAIATLAELGDGEGRTYARAHEVLAECAATSDAREDLQTAAESYRVAAHAWESCGEFARARMCRSSLALVALTPLGRFDEALAQIGQLLASPDLSDAERSWTVYSEGFVLLNANRLDSAESRFMRLADLGYLHDNPRLIAAAAWGMAVVAQRRTDLPGTLRWIATAENTALGEADDMLGVPFLCDAAMMLGALGELESAANYLARATERRAVFPGQVISATFILDARNGVVGDVEEALACTLPVAWWQVKLVAAYALAHQGDLDAARRMADDATRELVGLGFSDFTALGEGRTHLALQAALAAPGSERPRVAVATAAPAPVPAPGRRLLVMGRVDLVGRGRRRDARAARQPAAPRRGRRRGRWVRHVGPRQRCDLAGRRRRDQPDAVAQRPAPVAPRRRRRDRALRQRAAPGRRADLRPPRLPARDR